MKLAGVEIDATYKKQIVFKRSKQDLVFKLVAVSDYEDFEKVCKTPEAPWITKRGEEEAVRSLDDPEYTKAMEDWAGKKYSWMCLKTLEPSEITWDSVDLSDSETYVNWTDDLLKAGFAEGEVIRLQREIATVNGLTAEAISETEADF